MFSALGFYPVCPASDEYAIGSPLFRKAVVHLENGEDLVISAPENSSETPYVRSVRVNGRKLDRWFLNHSVISMGADVDFSVASK